jgi:di/tripeptidase
MYTIAVMAYDAEGGERVLELHGPLQSQDRAKELAQLMNDRLLNADDELREGVQDYVDGELWFEAVVLPVRPVKVKRAVAAAKEFMTAMYRENTQAPGRYEEVVSSELLNAPPEQRRPA